MIKGKSAATVEDFKNVEAVFNFAMLGANINNLGSSIDQDSRTDFQLAGSTTKRKLNDNPEPNR